MNGIAQYALNLICCIQSKREIFEAHAYQGNADMANKERLRPGDRALMRGTLQQQTIALENGATTIVNHFYVTSLEVLSRSKRTSMTVYEKGKTR